MAIVHPIPKENSLRGIIFDLDGTLANTQLDFAQMCLDAGLPVGTRILEYCAQLDDVDRVEKILTIFEKHEMDGAKRADWILDAEDVLQQLKNANIPMAIVTRNMREATQTVIERLKIPIDLFITREDCAPKPDPEGLIIVSQQWGIPANKLAYVGDFRFDLMAAKKAGMLACLLSNQRNREFHSMADKVIENFCQLKSLVCFDDYNQG